MRGRGRQLRDTNKMGKYKLRATRESERREQSGEGKQTNYVPAQDLIRCLEAKAEIITLPPRDNVIAGQILIPPLNPRRERERESRGKSPHPSLPRPTPHIPFPPATNTPLMFLLEGGSRMKRHSRPSHPF